MKRLLLPCVAVALLAGLIGCGGGTVDDGVATTGTSGGTTTTDVRPPAGAYTATLAGTDNAATAGAYTATGGTATVSANGAVSVTLAVAKNGATTTTSRAYALTVTAAGVASGTLAQDTNEVLTASGTLTDNTNGTYLLTVATSSGSVVETDKITLTGLLPAVGTYTGAISGTDTQGATYTGSGTATVGSGGSLSVAFSSSHHLSGATITKSESITGATLTAAGTFSGVLNQGDGTLPASTTVTGTYTLASNVLTLRFSYVDTTFTSANGHPTVTETQTLTKG